MTGEVVCGARIFAEHACSRLVHDLDPAFLDAGEDQLAIRIGDLIVDVEAQTLSPELDARFDRVHYQHRSELLECRRWCVRILRFSHGHLGVATTITKNRSACEADRFNFRVVYR